MLRYLYIISMNCNLCTTYFKENMYYLENAEHFSFSELEINFYIKVELISKPAPT